jgi:hypothetical protein
MDLRDGYRDEQNLSDELSRSSNRVVFKPIMREAVAGFRILRPLSVVEPGAWPTLGSGRIDRQVLPGRGREAGPGAAHGPNSPARVVAHAQIC